MRSKHLSVRKCIDKKPDKIKGIVCICIILAVVCAGNMIQNYLISLKAAKIAKTSTTISNADISPYSHSISAEERLTKMMSLMQDNVNELWNGKYSEKREPLDTEIPVGQAYTAMYTLVHRTSCRWNIRLLQESKDLKKRESKCHHIIRVLIYVCTNRTKKLSVQCTGAF